LGEFIYRGGDREVKVRRKAGILGFYISAALVIQYAVGGKFGKVAFALLAVHFIFQILHGYYEGTISKKYSVGLGVLSCVALIVADFLESLVVRAFTKLYLVYISLSRNHLDNTAVWPIQWYALSA
jgi:isoprenylcysteine carboxyl methyltransferase (ICMT) family protein YpbQ